jgi:hypothetical protein
MEITVRWRPIIGYEKEYLISSHGHVKSGRTGRILKQWSCYGYPYCGLSKNGHYKRFRTHKLVALMFLGPCPEGKQINHKDGNKANNFFLNLEYVTASENVKHSYENGLSKIRTGEKHWSSKLNRNMVDEICFLYFSGLKNSVELANKYKVSQPTISAVIRGERWI